MLINELNVYYDPRPNPQGTNNDFGLSQEDMHWEKGIQ